MFQLPENSKIEKCAAKNDCRQYLNHPYLDLSDAKAPVLVATDGHKAAIVPVTLVEGEPADSSGPISADALVAARKVSKLAGRIMANGSLDVLNGPTFPRPDFDGQSYPDWRRIVPPAREVCDIAFNAKYLYELAQALNGGGAYGDNVKLIFARNADGSINSGGAIRVECAVPDRIGVLMPVRA